MMNNEDRPITAFDFKVRDISKTFIQGPTRLEVLKGIDLDLQKGEMIAIVGTSGTGKTTFLQILGGLDRPSSGSILYNNDDICRKGDRDLSEFRNNTVGFVFQFHHLLPEFTAFENVMMPGLIGGRNKEELTRKTAELLDLVGLVERTDHKIGELSGGEQQRVALARALIMEPALLLADEPTGNLDPATGNKVFELIRKMNRELGLTTVMVTHNHSLAKRMDRCLTLQEGFLRETVLAD